ncbi:CARDB/Protein of unknown function (DUF3344) [Methanocella conradii HZ254]|uniref:CARDB domain-containing protein n=1 Tax=Methanocella conradii (strain DSM 24694 / JCM 17849 / CGMCC 1.5162 / HZ254) TaxID=1041930 RepID=H8I8W6_METCZ|nr:DUF3344 domain-containing protein [Methanocella conradii]AFD00437.1 CARDB/Protein of unknown function (DUF3344) [Methanocella conradii HZ254]
MTFQTVGLVNPPVSCEFELPGEVEWARVYTGVWGGTPKYRGWAQVQVNDHLFDRAILYGEDDTNDNVFVTGYGVYWIAYDATSWLKKGDNKVTVNTSQRDPESKIDGRVYAIFVVAAIKDTKGKVTEYWVTEGNVNLHSTGWTAGTNANELDDTSVTFSGVDTSGEKATLTTIELTGTRGQPDYIQLNGKDLGSPPADQSLYLPGAIDIGDECSFNANGGTGVSSRYVDVETFDVTGKLTGHDTLTFQRGRDLNGDGEITTTGDKPEGEDYIHPVFAMITVQKAKTAATGPDLAIEGVSAVNAYEGETGQLVATLKNLGTTVDSADVTFSVDGKELTTRHVAVDKSGIQQVSADWKATSGEHVIKVEARVDGDTDASNNVGSATIKVGSLPDLVLTMSAPTRPGASNQAGTPFILTAIGIVLTFALVSLRPPGKRPRSILPAIVLLSVALIALQYSLPAVQAADDSGLYLLPVSVKNIGGSNTPAFNLTIYIDGHKAALKSINEGVRAGEEKKLDIPLYSSSGKHKIKVIADEAGLIKEANKANNVAEADYDLP